MSQRLEVKEMVMQMHEKNLVLMNILRDIVENETANHFPHNATEEEIVRCLADKVVRRAEILGEINHVLLLEDLGRRKPARAKDKVTALR
jgi:hypothetical protein